MLLLCRLQSMMQCMVEDKGDRLCAMDDLCAQAYQYAFVYVHKYLKYIHIYMSTYK
jgi:hypothetical protein